MTGLDVAILHDDTDHFDGPAGKEAFLGVWEAILPVEEALLRLGHRSRRVSLGVGFAEVVRTLNLARPDVVFHLAETVRGDTAGEAMVTGALDLLDLAYTSEPHDTLVVARDKTRTKALLEAARVPTPPYVVSPDGVLPSNLPPSPWISKPALEGGSVGIESDAVSAAREELAERVHSLYRIFRTPVLIESFIEGTEFHAGIVGSEWLPLVEIDFSGLPSGHAHICSYESKWIYSSTEFKGVHFICPARVHPSLQERLLSVARSAARSIGIESYCRFDIRMDHEARLFVLDVNPNPDISLIGTMPKMAEAAGWGFDGLIQRLLDVAVKRRQARKNRFHSP